MKPYSNSRGGKFENVFNLKTLHRYCSRGGSRMLEGRRGWGVDGPQSISAPVIDLGLDLLLGPPAQTEQRRIQGGGGHRGHVPPFSFPNLYTHF